MGRGECRTELSRIRVSGLYLSGLKILGNWRAQKIRISNESRGGELRGPGVLRANQESSFARARRSGNCPWFGGAPGGSRARRAVYGAAERTLDAPKRSRKMVNRSDRKPGRDHSWKVGRNACGNRRQKRSCSCGSFLEETWRSGSCGFSDSIPTRTTHAPQHINGTDIWGVSDPAGRLWGRVPARRRGRSRPFLAATPVLGRFPGGTNRRPSWLGPTAQDCSIHGLRRLRPETR